MLDQLTKGLAQIPREGLQRVLEACEKRPDTVLTDGMVTDTGGA